MNRKQLRALWAQLSSEESGVSPWQAMRTQDLQQLQKSVDEAKQSLVYWVFETRLFRVTASLGLLVTLAWALAWALAIPQEPLTFELLLGGAIVAAAVWVVCSVVICILFVAISDRWISPITRLGDALKPLNQSLLGCAEAVKLVEESKRCKAHQLAVVHEGREFLEGDLTLLYRLARQDRHDAYERSRVQACQALHLLTSEALADA